MTHEELSAIVRSLPEGISVDDVVKLMCYIVHTYEMHSVYRDIAVLFLVNMDTFIKNLQAEAEAASMAGGVN